MKFHRYTIDVSKLGYGDVWELTYELQHDYNPETLTLDFVKEKLVMRLQCNEVTARKIEERLNNSYDNMPWKCDADI